MCSEYDVYDKTVFGVLVYCVRYDFGCRIFLNAFAHGGVFPNFPSERFVSATFTLDVVQGPEGPSSPLDGIYFVAN